MKKHLQKLKFCILILSCIGLFSNCNNSQKQQKPIVYLLLKTTDNPFFQDIQKGASENLMNKFDLQVRAGKNEADVKSQMEVLQSLVTDAKNNEKKVAGVIITPTSSGSELIPMLKDLKDLEVPIILVDTRIDTNLLKNGGVGLLPFIGSSNRDGGKQAGYFMASQLKSGGNLLILNGVADQETAQQRFEGFKSVVDSITSSGSSKFTYTVRTANWRRSEAIKITSALYSYGNKFDGIFAGNDEMALGAYQTLADLKISPLPIIIGFDATDEARKAVTDKKLTATIAQSPYQMGKQAVVMVDKIISKESVQIENPISTELIK